MAASSERDESRISKSKDDLVKSQLVYSGLVLNAEIVFGSAPKDQVMMDQDKEALTNRPRS